MERISLLWSEDDRRVSFDTFRFLDELQVRQLVPIGKNNPIGELMPDLSTFFTVNEKTIEMRNALFSELLETPELFAGLDQSFAKLAGIFEIRREKNGILTNEQLLLHVKELELYIDYIKDVRNIFSSFAVKSEALHTLGEWVASIHDSAEFHSLCEETEKQNRTVRNIKSITVGINLDAALVPIEAGLLQVNDQPFLSGDVVNKLLRLDFSKNKYYCTAPLAPISKSLSGDEYAAIRASVNASMNKVFAKSLKSWASIIRKYVIGNLNILTEAVTEWKFISCCVRALSELKQKGYPLCVARFGEQDAVSDLYHPLFALTAEKREIVRNDLLLDVKNRVYVLSGPNQGGKSVYTQAVGLLYAMLHLGMLLPAESAVLRPVNAILTHFAGTSNGNFEHGRLQEECDRMNQMNEHITSHSIVLLDEAFSSTNETEGSAICSEVLKAYAKVGLRCICATHFHALCSLEDSIDGIRNLSAQIDEGTHERVFKIVPGFGNRSYASDIAKKYGITMEGILSQAQNC